MVELFDDANIAQTHASQFDAFIVILGSAFLTAPLGTIGRGTAVVRTATSRHPASRATSSIVQRDESKK
jgi:hypothetical protein